MATKNPFGQLRVVDRDEDEEVAQKVSKTTPAATLFSNAQTEQKKKKKVRPDEKKQSEEHPVQESTEGFQVVRKNKQKPRTFEPVKEGDFEDKKSINPKVSNRKVLGIDIDIRAHNRAAIEAHPMASRIQMIQGSSFAEDIIAQVHAVAAKYSKVLVCLDSNHTHDHVLAELNAYAPLTSAGSYCVVFDTVVEDLPKEMFPDRPWGPGNNPKTAVWEYLKTHPEFQIDKSIQDKLLITVAPDGYLKRIA